MGQAQFEALVKRMARLAQCSPRFYRWRAYALAVLGCAALAAVVLALLLLLAPSVEIALHARYAVKFVMPIGALLLVVLRALWVRSQPPEGERLARRDPPELFALLDRLRARLGTPPVHEVLVTADFGAGITQVPRLGYVAGTATT